MNQLLQEAFERAANLPEGEQDRFAGFCCLSWNRSVGGLRFLRVRNLRTC